LYGNITD